MSLHVDFGLPEREADQLTGTGRARLSHKDVNKEFFSYAHKAGWTCWRTACAIADAALNNRGIETVGARRNLIAIRLDAAARGKRNMTLLKEQIPERPANKRLSCGLVLGFNDARS